jgi:vacuolar-type H+-ATPase subunit I/STV1
MRIRGHTVRILGNVLAALGAVLLVAGIVAAAIGMLWAKDASSGNQRPPEDLKDVIGGLVVGGLASTGVGALALVLGLVLRGVGRALHERATRIDAAAAPGASKAA